MADLAAELAMDRANAEIEAAEDDAEEPEHGGASVLRRAWSIGKGVAIAGAVITSAPIVIPPLVFLSALGLALSLPSGIYLAGYACTVKLMGALLPLPAEDGEDAAADRGFDIAGEDEDAVGEISKGTSSSSRSEEEELKEKDGEKEEMAEAVAEDENGNRHCSLQEAMGEAKQVEEEEEEEEDLEEASESLKSPYADRGFDDAGEDEDAAGGISKGTSSRSEEEELKEKVGEKEEMVEADAADENGNRHCSLQEAMGEAKQVEEEEEEEEDLEEISESLKSPYAVALMAPEEERENEPPSLSQEHLSIVECASSAVDVCPKKEEEDGKLDRNRHYSGHEAIRDLEDASGAASESDEERKREKEPFPRSSCTVVLMVPKTERETRKNELPNSSKEKKKLNPEEAAEVRGEDFERASSGDDVCPKKEEDEDLDGRKKKRWSRWACWKSHN